MRCRVFSVRQRRLREALVPPATEAREGDFFVIDAPDWVNVVALTPQDALVLIHQWRHGVDHATLEIPGGMVDPGETPAQAAVRELREETGARATRWLKLGAVEPNPAIQSNRCHTYLALHCTLDQPLEPDGNERIHVELLPYAEVPKLLAGGQISHALVIAALAFEGLRRGGVLRPSEAL